MGNKLKTKERKYFFTQHVHSLRNLLQRGASDGRCLLIGKEAGACNAAFLVPQTPRGLLRLLAMTGEEDASGSLMACDDWMGSEASFLCRVTHQLVSQHPSKVGLRVRGSHPSVSRERVIAVTADLGTAL